MVLFFTPPPRLGRAVPTARVSQRGAFGSRGSLQSIPAAGFRSARHRCSTGRGAHTRLPHGERSQLLSLVLVLVVRQAALASETHVVVDPRSSDPVVVFTNKRLGPPKNSPRVMICHRRPPIASLVIRNRLYQADSGLAV